MTLSRPAVLRPGMFGIDSPADTHRDVFDLHNEALIAQAVPIDAVFVGDSITEGWALDAFFAARDGLLVNRGISGDRSEFVRRRFAADSLQLRPKLIVLMIGVNNTGDLDRPWELQTHRAPEQIEMQVASDVEAMARAARDERTPLALCSILPTNIPTETYAPVRNTLIGAVNRRLRQIAEKHGAVYVDLHGPMSSSDGLTLQSELADDGLHPHLLGYRLMTATLVGALRQAGLQVLSARGEDMAGD